MLKSHKKYQKSFHSNTHYKVPELIPYKKDLIWNIDHFPKPEDLATLKLFFRKFNSALLKDNGKTFEYRFFLKDTTSLHVIFHKKSFGFAINAHIDVVIHGKVLYNEFTFNFLIKLKQYLKKLHGYTYFKSI